MGIRDRDEGRGSDGDFRKKSWNAENFQSEVVRDFDQIKGDGIITQSIANIGLSALDIDSEELNTSD